MLFVSLALVAAGIGLGILIYRRPARSIRSQQTRRRAFFRFLENRMWLDELYDWTILAVARFAARLSDLLDRYLWDGLVRLVGGIGRLVGGLTKGFDERGDQRRGRRCDHGRDARSRPARSPRATPARSRLISAPSRSACSRFFFFTHGSPDHRPDFHSAPRRALSSACAPRRYAPRRRAREHVHHCAARAVDAVAITSIADATGHCKWCSATSGFRRSARRALVGIDGLSLLLVLLTSLIFPFALLAQRMEPRFLRAHARDAGGALRHLHRAKFHSLVSVLRDEPDSGFPAHQNLGRRKTRPRGDQVFPLHLSRQRRDAALVSRDLFRQGNVRFRGAGVVRQERACSRAICAGSPLPEFFSGSRSRCRSFRFTPGCPTPTKRRRPGRRWS